MLLAAGFRMLGASHPVLDADYSMLGAGFEMLDSKLNVENPCQLTILFFRSVFPAFR
jgi:hypothetical protein